MQKIGILYICTGKYDIFWEDFYLSSEKYLLNDKDENGNKKFEKYYFVWTDAKEIFAENENKNIRKIYQENLGWPGNTLMRFDMFLGQKEGLQKMDYLFFFNANGLIVEDISEKEFLPDKSKNEYLIGSLHPGFFKKNRKKFTYDENPNSLACISKDKGKNYFMGALLGGESRAFLEACEVMDRNIKIDLEKKIIARFHDESHWNRYLIDRSDIKKLGPEYLHPENWNINLNVPTKIIMRQKEAYMKSNLFNWKNDDQYYLKKIFLNIKKKIGDVLKKNGIKKY